MGIRVNGYGKIDMSLDISELLLTKWILSQGMMSTDIWWADMPYTTEQIKTTPHKWTPTVETFRTMKSSWPDVIHVGYDEMLIDYEGERVINGLYRVTSVQSYDIRGSNLLFQFKGDGATSGTAPRCIVKRHSQAPPEVWWGDTTVQRSMKFFEEYMVTHLKEHPLSSLSDMEICQRFIHQDMHELLV